MPTQISVLGDSLILKVAPLIGIRHAKIFTSYTYEEILSDGKKAAEALIKSYDFYKHGLTLSYFDPDLFKNCFDGGFVYQDRIKELIKCNDILSENLDVPVTGILTAPFTLCYQKFGSDFLFKIKKDVEQAKDILDEAAETVIELSEFIETSYYFLGDPCASQDLISPENFLELALPYQNLVLNKLKGQRILHICGELKVSLEKSFAEILSLEEDIKKIDTKKILMGGINSKDLYKEKFNDVERKIKYLANLKDKKIILSCEGLLEDTPKENVKKIIETGKKYSSF